MGAHFMAKRVKSLTIAEQCSCFQDPFASLPPELRPPSKTSLGDLRRVMCPACGKLYRTNRKTDLCLDCEKKEVSSAQTGNIGEKESLE